MNPFASRITHANWVVPVTALSVLLGFMIALSWVTNSNRSSRISLLDADQGTRVRNGPPDVQEAYLQLSNEVEKLRADKTKLENSIASQTGSTKLLNDGLQEAKIVGALTPLEGPGVIVTLQDSRLPVTSLSGDKNIHDLDVLRIVNELWSAGAEGISVNNHRAGTATSIRCVGPVVHVDGIPISSPVVIRAIGDSQTLLGALNLPLGVLAEIRQTDPAMVQLEKAAMISLPAYAGSTTRRYARVPKESK